MNFRCNFQAFTAEKLKASLMAGTSAATAAHLLVRQIDRWIGLTKRSAEVLPDRRDPDRITHSLESLLQQRLYGLALGYADRECE